MGRQSLKSRADRKTASAITAARTDAVDQMGSKLLRKFRKLEKSVNDLRADNLRYYHQMGKICEEIRENPEDYIGNDGTPGLKLIERALSTQARTLRKAASFASMYDDAQLDELISLKSADGSFSLHWGHVGFLLTIPTEERRARYAQEAVNKMLDPGALHELIKKRTQRSGGHGRKHEMPKTVPAQIRQIIKICKQWAAKNEDVWNGDDESVFGNILNLPPADMEAEMIEQMQEIAVLMQAISDAAVDNVAIANRVKEHLQATIETRDREAAEEAAAEAAGGVLSGRKNRSIDLQSDGASQRPAATV